MWRGSSPSWRPLGLPSSRRTIITAQSLSLAKETQRWNKNSPFLLHRGRVCILGWLPAPWSGGGLTSGERSQLKQRVTDPGPGEGGSDSEPRGWVRRHVLNRHSTASMVSVCAIMVRMSYLLSVYSGMIKAVGSVALPWLCGPINFYGSLFFISSIVKRNSKCFLMAYNSPFISSIKSSVQWVTAELHCWSQFPGWEVTIYFH